MSSLIWNPSPTQRADDEPVERDCGINARCEREEQEDTPPPLASSSSIGAVSAAPQSKAKLAPKVFA
jgi:hypothetical protein